MVKKTYIFNQSPSKSNKQKGYALMFTLLIISLIVAIASGVALTLSKNLVLANTARESQEAFYQADTAGECALFAMRFIDLDDYVSNGTIFSCGDLDLDVSSVVANKYTLSDSGLIGTTDPCFTIDIDNTGSPDVAIEARGYNACGGEDVVERGIEITY